MKEYPITFAIQETPHDPFDAESVLIYRGVVKCKGLFDGALPITEALDDAEYVFSLVQEYITNDARNRILDTRFANINDRIDQTAINLSDDILRAENKAVAMMTAHTSSYKHKQ